MTSAGTGGSVFLAALGERAADLRTEVREFLAQPEPGGIGIGTGEFDVAGSPLRWLLLPGRPILGPGMIVTAYERRVPFTLWNRPTVTESGVHELRAERAFAFRRGTQRFVDVLREGEQPGTLENRLGRAGRVHAVLSCEVTPDGHLLMQSDRVDLCFGRWRIPLRGPFGLRISLVNGFDHMTGRLTVDARVRSVVVGTITEYRGTFTYRVG